MRLLEAAVSAYMARFLGPERCSAAREGEPAAAGAGAPTRGAQSEARRDARGAHDRAGAPVRLCVHACRALVWGLARFVPLLALFALAPRARAAGEDELGEAAHMRWLLELGAESHAAVPQPSEAGEIVWVNVPGAALSFEVREDGSLRRRRRVPTDFSTGYGLATAEPGAVVADRDGGIAFFARSHARGGDELRWRRDPAERISSLGWNGGAQIWATAEERLLALRAEDGATLWSTPIAGRAAAPAVGTASDVFVATKANALQRIDAARGALRWTAALDGPALHAPVLIGPGAQGEPALVICGTWSGTLFAFDTESGHLAWSTAVGSRLASAPVVWEDRVAVAGEDGAVRAYTRAGAPLWQTPQSVEGMAALFAPPAAAGGAAEAGPARALLVAVSTRLVALDASTGERVAAYPDGALEQLRQRFHRQMMEGEGVASEAERSAAQEREAFPLAGLLFGAPRIQAGGIAFGTEEGWIYRFDLATLRPSFRYRAGVPASGLHGVTTAHILVSAGDEVFALAPGTGEIVWRRGVGGTVQQIAGQALLSVLTRDRLTELDARDGMRRWSKPIQAVFVADHAAAAAAGTSADGGPAWFWVNEGPNRLQILDAHGQLRDALTVSGNLLPPVAVPGTAAWIAATREGGVFRFAGPAADGGGNALASEPGAQPSGFRIVWEQRLKEPVTEVRVEGTAVLLRLASGTLVQLDAGSGTERWRLALESSEDYEIAAGSALFVVFGSVSLRVHDLATAQVQLERELPAPAVAAMLRAGRLYWLDRDGGAHVVDASADRLLASNQLGVSLKAAAAAPDGFVVLTAAGEVGFAELGPARTKVTAGHTP